MRFDSQLIIRALLISSAVLCASFTAISVNAQEIITSHAFSSNELTQLPTSNWLTNGGNVYNQCFPPDLPPTLEFAMFPTVYEIPFSFDNPVTGRQ